MRKRVIKGAVLFAAVGLLLRIALPLIVTSKTAAMEVTPGSDARTLVVVLHGFGGRSRDGLIRLARTAYPDAHLLAPAYNAGWLSWLSNRSPYDIADVLETSINDAFRTYHYERIVLIGHSFGGELVRKVYLWGAGEEADRPAARRGRHAWVDKVTRIVSLASINRGWTVDPAPPNMAWYTRAAINAGVLFGKLTGTGHLVLESRRGAPFVADSRVQWIHLARLNGASVTLPPVIHLLGTQDDIATPEDTRDAQAAKDFKFKSLPNTNHADIATSLSEELGPNGPLTARARAILECVTQPLDQIAFDEPETFVENRNVRRVVFILHGIRDYDAWGVQLQQQIVSGLGQRTDTEVVVPKYGYFPMAPFLLWGDRQEKVRWFMDVYTEARAQFPHADQFDFIGHSNGTYILASALQKYRTLQVHDVYFAGSVVPQRYPWAKLVRDGRVAHVRNVVATNDWVVALFPRFFEQVAEWSGRASDPGSLDIGAAGFRGFQDAGRSGTGVRDIAFANGEHSTGVDLTVEPKREALVRFGVVGLDANQEQLFSSAFANAKTQNSFMDLLSNVSWVAWLIIVAIVAGGAWLAWRRHWAAALVYTLVVVAILNSL